MACGDQRDEKYVMLVYLTATQAISDEEYLKVMNRFQALFPEDPSLLLVSLDYHILKREPDKALAAIDQLDAIVKDPYLDILRSVVELARGRPEAAEGLATRAIERGEKREDAYTVLLDSLVYQKKYPEAVEIASVLKERFDSEIDVFRQKEESYQAFMASEAYQKWLESALD
jgi:hypothetical protein